MSEMEIARAYCTLMQEARVRLEVIRHIDENSAKLPAPIVSEICYLQLRLLCEIVAVCCLVAHGDAAIKESAKTAYEPKKILKEAEQLNPYFYPQPIQQTTTEKESGRLHHIATIPNGEHLTKQELLSLWGRCGDVLHRSPMIKAIKVQTLGPQDRAEVHKWFIKILGLLDHHWITLVPNEKGLIASFASVHAPNATLTFLDFLPNGIVNRRTVFLS